MTKISLILIALAAIAGTASAQQSRTFDNFDRSQGVSVYMPPPPPTKATVKRKRVNGKWVVVTEDNTPLVKKTGSTRVANVTDGLATREAGYNSRGVKLSMGSSSNLKGFTTGNPLYDSYIVESSRRYRVDPLLIYAQMHQESSFKLKATSHKGASGLMQLMPATARRFGVTSIYDPKQNIDAGVKYMRWLLDTFGQDVSLALAGYNAGEGAVMKYGWKIPPYRETQEYVRRIAARYTMIADGRYVQTARNINDSTAKLTQKESAPLNALEVPPVTIKGADGRLILMNQ